MPSKDPQAKLPFAVDWTQWLAKEDDTIASVDWTVPDGITQASPPPSHDSGKAVIWLSGGENGESYDLVCQVTTTGGRIDERTLQVWVEHR